MAAPSQRRGGGTPGPHQECGQQGPGGGDGSPHGLDPERGNFHRLQQAEVGRVQAADVGETASGVAGSYLSPRSKVT